MHGTKSLKYLGSLFLDPEDIRKLSIGAIWNFAKGTGLLYLNTEHGAQRACPKAQVHRAQKGLNSNITKQRQQLSHTL